MTNSTYRGYHSKYKVEVFQHPQDYNLTENVEQDQFLYPKGWYWWSCLPGCLPDGEPAGPFKSAREAYQDARGV